MRKLLLAILTLLFTCQAWADDPEQIQDQIADIDSKLKYLREELDRTPGEEAEAIIHDIYFLRVDRLGLLEDLAAATITDSRKLEREQTKLERDRAELDRAHDSAIANVRRSIKPIVQADGLSIAEMKRSSGYVTYSIRLDVDNPGPPGKIFVDIKGKRYDGHILDGTTLMAEIVGNNSSTLTDTTMVTVQDALNISRWEITEVTFYPN